MKRTSKVKKSPKMKTTPKMNMFYKMKTISKMITLKKSEDDLKYQIHLNIDDDFKIKGVHLK